MNQRTLDTSVRERIAPPVPGRILQRKCACGQHTVGGGECENCKKKKAHATEGIQSHDPQARTSGAEFAGHDFSGVKTHSRVSYIGEIDDTPAFDPEAKSADSGGAGSKSKSKSKDCSDICSRAYSDSSLNGGGGGVICDGTTKCPCVFDVAPLTKGQCPEFDENVLTHEKEHLSDVDCDPKKGLHRPPFRDQSKAVSSECKHRKASIADLDKKIPKATGDCKTGMTSIRGALKTWVDANC